MGLMSQSLFSLQCFSRSVNNRIVMGRSIMITQASQRAYDAIRNSGEKPPWTADRETGYYRPETIAKELGPYIVTTSKSEVTTTRRGEKLWWMPDLQTGFYRPDTFVRELDAAELRSMHLNENENTA
ncbi:unnamed protein product [Thlaspi arvense]|uniref:Uncharacterized protein n=1 Tax=Thlaspi arvense TaxID=13288 RepID=A0AAU9SI47_THLAR|nr:unnamed protein product [Thlaspi arvense]